MMEPVSPCGDIGTCKSLLLLGGHEDPARPVEDVGKQDAQQREPAQRIVYLDPFLAIRRCSHACPPPGRARSEA